MLALLEPATECAETKMCQANLAPASDTACPFGFARPDNSDTSFDAKARRIAARGLRLYQGGDDVSGRVAGGRTHITYVCSLLRVVILLPNKM